MKKTIKTAFTISCILFILGLTTCTITLLVTGFNFSKILNNNSSNSTQINKQVPLSDNISLFLFRGNHTFVGVSPDDKIHISYYDFDNIKYEFEQNSNELILKEIINLNSTLNKSRRTWSKSLRRMFYAFTQDTTILIPKQFKGILIGNISSGRITFENISANNIDLELSGGMINIENISANNIDLELFGSMINVKNISANRINLSDKSGTTKIEQIVSTENSTIRLSSGQATINNVYSDTDINLASSSGFIKFSKLDAQNIALNLNGGSVDGSIVGNENDFTVIYSTSKPYNSLGLPKSGGQGSKTLTISVSAGAANISFEE